MLTCGRECGGGGVWHYWDFGVIGSLALLGVWYYWEFLGVRTAPIIISLHSMVVFGAFSVRVGLLEPTDRSDTLKSGNHALGKNQPKTEHCRRT